MTTGKKAIFSNSDEKNFVRVKDLELLLKDIFVKWNVPKRDAAIMADVLITSDLRGIDTHGIQRCKMYYDRIKEGIYEPKTRFKIAKNTPTTAVIDGQCGLGPVIGYKSMKLAIKKAKKYGIGAVAVRNSTHFGIAGYYSLMAIKEGMIGITTTNARPAVPPTFGVEPMLGTNPLTAGAPTDEKFPFLIDCATSIIQRGKVELYNREHISLPNEVTITPNGKCEKDPGLLLNNLEHNNAALLPLGGLGESRSGYKGYGYATLVEILSSALQDGIFLKDTAGLTEDGQKRLKVGHFFLALNVEAFTSLTNFKKTTGSIMRKLRASKKMPGKNRIYTAGEKEYYCELERKKKGIPLTKSIQEDLVQIINELELYHYLQIFKK
jgi:L-2-hydroxycarboxylate dehydrogenase (NAD+)